MHCFAHVHRRRKPSAPGAFCTVLLMEQVAEATCIFVQKALKWPKSLLAHVAIATCASAKRPLQARVRWHDASQVAWSLLPGPISPRCGHSILHADHGRTRTHCALERCMPSCHQATSMLEEGAHTMARHMAHGAYGHVPPRMADHGGPAPRSRPRSGDLLGDYSLG